MRRCCLTLELRNDLELITEYIRLHYPHGRSEINESIRAADILDMQIYHLGTRLFMIMDVSDDSALSVRLSSTAGTPPYRNGKR